MPDLLNEDSDKKNSNFFMTREPLEKKFLKPFHMIREKENIIEICLIMHTDK